MIFGSWDENHTGRGTLLFKDSTQCPICQENKRGVSQPNCEHFACINCFKQCYRGAGGPQSINIYDQYDDGPDSLHWATEYPLIGVYDKWNDDMLFDLINSQFQFSQRTRTFIKKIKIARHLRPMNC